MYSSGIIEIALKEIESYQANFIFALCLVVPLIFFLVLLAFCRSRRIAKRVDELTLAVKGLINEQEARYTRDLLGRRKDKGAG
jgi:hypothetical protein